MQTEERIQLIKSRLTAALTPSFLEVIDDSHKHIGHAGSQGGAGHYTVILTAATLKNKNRVTAHREIYALLNDLIPHEIHALRIIIKP